MGQRDGSSRTSIANACALDFLETLHLAQNMSKQLSMREVTADDSHFFGFHDLTPWNEQTDELIVLRTRTSEDHAPTYADHASVVVISEHSGEQETVGQTQAWNWQKGARQRFLPRLGRRYVAFNVVLSSGFGCRLLDLDAAPAGREVALLPRALYDIHDGRGFGLSLDFRKLYDLQPGYGYAHPGDLQSEGSADGIWRVELATGVARQIFSLKEFLLTNGLSADLGRHFLTHIQISPDGERYAVLHRCFLNSGSLLNNLVVADTNGGAHKIIHNDKLTHFDWSSPTRLVAWCRSNPAVRALQTSRLKTLVAPLYRLSRRIRTKSVRQHVYNEAFREIDVLSGVKRTLGKGVLTEDGHPQVNPRAPHIWVNDTYPDDQGVQTLMLFDATTGARRDLLSLRTPSSIRETIWRCDFHPRWKPNGAAVCFDSAHAGRRQVCIAQIPSEWTGL